VGRHSVIHLMRGQVFSIAGKTIFTMGGAASLDQAFRRENISWWKEEMPSDEKYAEALRNLDNSGWRVDYAVTHTVPGSILRELWPMAETDRLHEFLDSIKKKLNYTKWFSGHLHLDTEVNKKHTIKYQTIEQII
jgi:hypothetical protein